MRQTRDWIAREEQRDRLIRVEVEGWSKPSWVLPEDLPDLLSLGRGETPKGWEPISSTTEEEATFLAPLEVTIKDGRARRLFGFDYIWEVYIPAPKRRWGYYTLPILWGDRLRARMDLRYDKGTECLKVLGSWVENASDVRDADFARAVGKGLQRLRGMVGADRVDLSGIGSTVFKSRIAAESQP